MAPSLSTWAKHGRVADESASSIYGKPILVAVHTLRDGTEWVETVAYSRNRPRTALNWRSRRTDIPDFDSRDAGARVLDAIRGHWD